MKLLNSDIKTKEVLNWEGVHLINYQFSACSMKSRIYLNVKGIAYTSHWINLSTGENFSDWFQGISPRSLVPVLVHDGEVHIESNDILQHLERSFNDNPLIPIGYDDTVTELLQFEDDLHIDIRNITFKFLVPGFLTKVKSIKSKSNSKATLHGKSDLVDDQNRSFWKNFYEKGILNSAAKSSLIRMKAALDEINTNLQNSEFILGTNLSLIDIAWFIYATRLQNAGYPLKKLHPNVHIWYANLFQDERFSKEVKIPLLMKLITKLNLLILKFKKRDIETFLND